MGKCQNSHGERNSHGKCRNSHGNLNFDKDLDPFNILFLKLKHIEYVHKVIIDHIKSTKHAKQH